MIAKRYDGYCDIPIDVFYEKSRRALLLLGTIEDSNVPKELKIEARKNFVINCVTALEVFLKDMIVILLYSNEEWFYEKVKKLQKLRDIKLNLLDACKMFNKRKVSLGELIVATYSFQNIAHIEEVFSALTGEKFLDKVGKVKVEDEEGKSFVLNEKCPDWRKKLEELLNLRHRFVHQVSFKERLGLKRLKNLFECLVSFVEATEQYLLEFISCENGGVK
ncbi:HEPN domain-containing protein [Phorcysia thermohydrogeniphila]|uniref:RiboL-PSP-HEPN domain-containing protein n=1 Tax=Phorcysia thermohydrogeniphila TaxID=936138 RepID=A0A4R1G8L0_9BACT|nr:HEPN domain-containing protein [Phorcysia thermohydrogeniphila]TCK03948.1 hypothetical protein CLV27_1265 [Phorcysia thermohydrogeniphila]